MSGIDKANRINALVMLGWTEVIPERDGEPYRLIPPESLWNNRQSDYYVYDAIEIQEILSGKSVMLVGEK